VSKKKKIRTDFRKNRVVRTRETDWTRRDESAEEQSLHGERISGKGDLTRRRTVVGSEVDDANSAGMGVIRDVDTSKCLIGRVLEVGGLTSLVRADDGSDYRCATRRILKTLSTDQRHVVVAGDVVWIRPEGAGEGVIERVEPRHGVISRTSRGRQHVMVANVDQLIIVGSAAEPRLKPNLIDRLLLVAEQTKVRPVICINKIDLVDPASLVPLIGVYAQMGYMVQAVSVVTGLGIDRLRATVVGRTSVVSGQSGVGKSSLLNAIEPELGLRVAAVSEETEKGRHTTSSARMIPLSAGGYVIDTPGVRQFQLWDVIPEEVAGFYRDLRPYVNLCRFPDCTHTHEAGCAVKDAVADGQLDARRYESYCHLRAGDD
jgi:ribosome biogenesis GTPase / thiamine phosphate phosphatase